MTTIRALLAPGCLVAACIALAGCNTAGPDAGGVLSSLGTPRLAARECADIERDVAAAQPGDGLQALGAEAEAAGCQVPVPSAALTAVPVPTAPVEVSAELPPPADAPPPPAVATAVPPDVAPVATPRPVVDISIPNIASRSAWDAEPLPVGVAGLNPASEAARQTDATSPPAVKTTAAAPARKPAARPRPAGVPARTDG